MTALVVFNNGDAGKVVWCLSHIGTWAKVADNAYLVSCMLGVSQVRDAIAANTDADKFAVFGFGRSTSWASYGLPKEVMDWMLDNGKNNDG